MIKDFYGKYQPIINYYKIKLKEVYLFKHIYRDNDEKKTDISNDLNKDYDDDDDDAKSVSSYTSINSFSSLKTDFSDYNLLNTYSNEYLQNTKYIDQIIPLLRNNKNLEHDGIIGFFKLANKLRKYNFDSIFIFNSSARFNLIAKIAGIKNIFQYQMFNKKNQHIIKTAQKFLKKELNIKVKPNPRINIEKKQIISTRKKLKIKSYEKNILLGIGGSGPTKRVPAKKFIKFIELVSKKYKSRFFLATGKNSEEQKILKEILRSKYKSKCYKLDNLPIKKILPIISNCSIAICNDSSFSHLSAALKI